eukprot:5365355-Pleurochrysis_carterae.AAC.1
MLKESDLAAASSQWKDAGAVSSYLDMPCAVQTCAVSTSSRKRSFSGSRDRERRLAAGKRSLQAERSGLYRWIEAKFDGRCLVQFSSGSFLPFSAASCSVDTDSTALALAI